MPAPLSGLYGIAGRDPGPDGLLRDPVEVARALSAGGACCVQLRLKDVSGQELVEVARAVREVCRDAGVPFVVNDRADVAALVGADGVHVGPDDLPPAAARAVVGPGRWVGVSTHDPAEVEAAVAAGADYLGFGPVFDSPTKAGVRTARGTEGLAEAVRLAGGLPVVAIGGVTVPVRARRAIAAGAAAVAVISGVARAPDMISAAAGLVLGTSDKPLKEQPWRSSAS